MKICFCYHAFYPTKGGVEEVIMQISKELIKNGHKVTVVTSAHENRPLSEELNGIKIIRIKPLFNVFKVPIVLNIGKTLSKIDMDILHVHGTIPGFSDNPIFWAKKHNIPCVLTYHFDGNADNSIGSVFAYIYNNTINRIAVSKADVITATSDSYAKTSPVLKHHLNKVKIISNGVYLERFSENNDKEVQYIKEKYNLKEKNIVLFVGRIVGYKGLDYLIKTMKYVDDAILVVAGSNDLNCNSKYLKYVVKNKVKFLGHIPDEDLPPLFRASSVYCLPSINRGENFGITLLEAMASGTACVYTDIPGKDHMNSTYSLKAKPKNAKDLADKINILLKDENMRNRMGLNAKEAVNKFCWSKIVPEYLDIYSQLLKGDE